MVREECAQVLVRSTCKNLVDRIGDIGMAIFACFFMQSPSVPAHLRMLRGGSHQR